MIDSYVWTMPILMIDGGIRILIIPSEIPKLILPGLPECDIYTETGSITHCSLLLGLIIDTLSRQLYFVIVN